MPPGRVVGIRRFGVRLTVASHRVYGWCRPRIPWIKAALDRVLLDCGVKVGISLEVIS